MNLAPFSGPQSAVGMHQVGLQSLATNWVMLLGGLGLTMSRSYARAVEAVKAATAARIALGCIVRGGSAFNTLLRSTGVYRWSRKEGLCQVWGDWTGMVILLYVKNLLFCMSSELAAFGAVIARYYTKARCSRSGFRSK